MRNLNKEELLKLLIAYDEYIQNLNESDDYKNGVYPVCISEFYDNDFEFWKDNN